jgi:molybdopterin synthase catalytic subunit
MDIGAHRLLLSQVRYDQADDQEVIAIEYGAYEEMVQEKMQKSASRSLTGIR